MRTNSLAFRFLTISALWSVLALVVTAFLLTTLYKGNAERNFRELLTAHLYNLMGAVDVEPNGGLTGFPNLGDPHFKQPYSGWYWSVIPQSKKPGSSRSLKSASLVEDTLETPKSSDNPFKDGFSRHYQITGVQDENLVVVEAQIYLGEGDDIFRFLVAGNHDALDTEIQEFSRSLIVFLALFGLGMVISTFVIIKLGLRPLKRARNALNNIRNGDAERLEGEFPEEITPLITEMNALIAANRTVLERARTQVGNLAHALKTPISVLKNEARNPGNDLAQKVDEQAARMHDQVQHYLDRARIAAQAGSISARTEVEPVVQRMVRVMQRLNPHLQFEQAPPPADKPVFRGEQQDLEEVLGNLLENACKYAREKVRIDLKTKTENDHTETTILEFCVEDDGPGLSHSQRSTALKRGQRLDETRPGSGLGLSIVSDIISEYHGKLELSDSDLGGLRITFQLPAADTR
jgi:signal transduction histidine kinase